VWLMFNKMHAKSFVVLGNVISKVTQCKKFKSNLNKTPNFTDSGICSCAEANEVCDYQATDSAASKNNAFPFRK